MIALEIACTCFVVYICVHILSCTFLLERRINIVIINLSLNSLIKIFLVTIYILFVLDMVYKSVLHVKFELWVLSHK